VGGSESIGTECKIDPQIKRVGTGNGAVEVRAEVVMIGMNKTQTTLDESKTGDDVIER
jgi:hypothetical protein